MAFRITKQSDIYEINGVLNTQNTDFLKNYFDLLIEKSAFIKMSLNKIKNLDNKGVEFIASLYKKATEKNKVLFIVDLKDQQLVQLFKQENIFTY
ncbi:hypothetical protein R3X25_05965 [Lutibacter sp. TH_r2]|uniref:STAS domain-containing protein n=1 Tax=Lutibacter sp. TH_r2 TaxID=3082083 RepID=UPI002954D5D1|nr:STAS domain-containing protein [Lutibacter sp. TH_r2]MDV7186822.1 hypothetical protein [Lutibacter sp. TH_r2]